MSTPPLSTSSPLRLGLIGAGGRLRGVVKRLLQVAPAGRLAIAAIHDPDPKSHDPCRDIFGPGYRQAATEEEIFCDPEVDWVFIGSWNSQHARQAIRALEAGKNVFCEKPLAISLEECFAIREAAARSGKRFVFGLVLRYSVHYQRIVELLREGAIGTLVSFEFNETLAFNHGGYIFGNWRRKRANAGTHLLEKCCHDLDLSNWIVGSLPVRVASFGGRDFFTPANARQVERIGPNKEGTPAYASWPDPNRQDPFDGEADIFDNQVAILEYANGVRGTFHTNCNTAISERRFYLCGTEGTLRADLITGRIEVSRISWDDEVRMLNSNVAGGHGGGDERMAAGLVATLLEGAEPLASIREGIESAALAFALDQAADEGRVVDLRPVWERAGIDPARVV